MTLHIPLIAFIRRIKGLTEVIIIALAILQMAGCFYAGRWYYEKYSCEKRINEAVIEQAEMMERW